MPPLPVSIRFLLVSGKSGDSQRSFRASFPDTLAAPNPLAAGSAAIERRRAVGTSLCDLVVLEVRGFNLR